jgi:hypothetical protein
MNVSILHLGMKIVGNKYQRLLKLSFFTISTGSYWVLPCVKIFPPTNLIEN